MGSMRKFVRLAYIRFQVARLSRVHGLAIGRGVVFKKTPLIKIVPGAKIIIGANTTINSDNFGYHLNMHSPVKLLADRPGALIEIGEETRIHGSCVHAYKSVKIGSRCLIAANCQIIDGSGHELSFDDVDARINTTSEGYPIDIEDSVWIGANVIVLPGVRIGRGSVVAAGSVVTKSVPPMVVVAGNPAKIVKNMQDNQMAPVDYS